MKTLLKVMTVIVAVHRVVKASRRHKAVKAEVVTPRKVSVVNVNHDTVITETYQSGSENEPDCGVVKENTSDQYGIGVSVLAGSIPPFVAPAFIPGVVGEPFRKSSRRVGVDEDCSTSSPELEQRLGNENRQTEERSENNPTIITIPEIEPTLVSAGYF